MRQNLIADWPQRVTFYNYMIRFFNACVYQGDGSNDVPFNTIASILVMCYSECTFL